MAYKDLAALLSPTQFSQLQVVREHLLQDPKALDKTVQQKETTDGTQESLPNRGAVT